jgi:transposase
VKDAGNNSRAVYDEHRHLPVDYLGVLKRSDQRDLMDVGLDQYRGHHRGRQYYTTEKKVYGRLCRVVVTYSERRKEHELRGFNYRIEEAKKALRGVWHQYGGQESAERTQGRLDQVLRDQKVLTSQAGRYVAYEIQGPYLSVRRKGFECREKKKQFGKRVLFTNRLDMRPEEMIDLDAQRKKVEDAFRELKDREQVSIWSIRHWTDTKIRMHAFCCVLGLLLLKLLLLEAERADMGMSSKAWLLAMAGIREAYLAYPDERGERVLEKNNPLADSLIELYRLDRHL